MRCMLCAVWSLVVCMKYEICVHMSYGLCVVVHGMYVCYMLMSSCALTEPDVVSSSSGCSPPGSIPCAQHCCDSGQPLAVPFPLFLCPEGSMKQRSKGWGEPETASMTRITISCSFWRTLAQPTVRDCFWQLGGTSGRPWCLSLDMCSGHLTASVPEVSGSHRSDEQSNRQVTVNGHMAQESPALTRRKGRPPLAVLRPASELQGDLVSHLKPQLQAFPLLDLIIQSRVV